MQVLRINSRYLFPFGRSIQFQRFGYTESRKYSRYVGNLRPRLSGCLCGSTNRVFLLPNHNQFLPTTAAFSLFSRSSPTPPSADVGKPDLPYPLEEIGPIPEAPAVPSSDTLRELRTSIADNMREIGLASYLTPPGWIQNLLDILHTTTGLPWWEVIALSTVIVRTITLPVMIYSQRRTGLMQLHQADMKVLMDKAKDAQKTGDTYAYQMAMADVQEFMKEKHLPNMSKMFVPLLANGVVFMSYFVALRGMATAQLWSLKHEGALWFSDLTVGDPTLILPTICAVTLMAMLELGVEFGTGAQTMSPGVRWFVRLMPLSVILFGKMMPAAVLCYWVTSNFISLAISVAFRVPKIRALFKIPPLPKRTKTGSWLERLKPPESVKEFFRNPRVAWYAIKDWRKSRKATAPSAVQIRRTDAKRFKAAGEGPIPATFTFNPKVRYREVFEQKSAFRRVKEALFGQKKTEVKRRAAG